LAKERNTKLATTPAAKTTMKTCSEWVRTPARNAIPRKTKLRRILLKAATFAQSAADALRLSHRRNDMEK